MNRHSRHTYPKKEKIRGDIYNGFPSLRFYSKLKNNDRTFTFDELTKRWLDHQSDANEKKAELENVQAAQYTLEQAGQMTETIRIIFQQSKARLKHDIENAEEDRDLVQRAREEFMLWQASQPEQKVEST